MSSNSFLSVSLRLPRYRIMSSANSDSFTPSFPIWIPLISFSSLIVVARTPKTMLNNIGESGHPCLVPDLRGNAFSFSPLRMMLAVSVSQLTLYYYYIKVVSFFAHSLKSFYQEWMLNFVKSFFCLY
uniref:Uncharacterized protein n=1 Tax=Sus scrofa TaxID=9823 RepID=A0A8D2BIA6_PIG